MDATRATITHALETICDRVNYWLTYRDDKWCRQHAGELERGRDHAGELDSRSDDAGGRAYGDDDAVREFYRELAERQRADRWRTDSDPIRRLAYQPIAHELARLIAAEPRRAALIEPTGDGVPADRPMHSDDLADVHRVALVPTVSGDAGAVCGAGRPVHDSQVRPAGVRLRFAVDWRAIDRAIDRIFTRYTK